MFPAIEPKKLTGTEALTAPNGTKICSLVDFWSWAHSDILGNSERGALAEYIVACALGINNGKRVSWDKYDLQTTDGITIEVKTSGYVQTWEQKTLSKIIFGIQPTYGWDNITNEYDSQQKRQSDIYVFCVHKHKDQETVNPLMLSQWDFYLLPTHIIDKSLGNQKTVSLSTLLKIGAEKCEFDDLKARISELIQN